MARILIVDDNATIRQLLRTALEPEGHDIVEACNGDEGLERYQAAPTEVVITDILMPEKNGLELIEDLQREFPMVNIIAIFGSKHRFLESVQQLGVQYTFEKPFSIYQVRDAVEELVSRANANRFQPPLPSSGSQPCPLREGSGRRVTGAV